MTNTEIARLFRDIAAAYTIKDEREHRFQIIAYQKAADAIEKTSTELQNLYKEGELDNVPGIGASITQHLEELFKTGKVKHFEEVLEGIPPAVFPLLDVPSFGPKKAYRLVKEFKLTNEKTVLRDVEKLAEQGRIQDLEGFGEKSEEDIMQALGEYKTGTTKTDRMVLPYAYELAKRVLKYLQQSKDVLEVVPLGSLRRMAPTIGDIDIAVTSKNPKAVIEHFINYPHKERVIERGPVTASILVGGGKHVDLLVLDPESFGSLLQHFTGSKHHNVALREYAIKKGLSLSERGIKIVKARNQKLVASSSSAKRPMVQGKLITFKTEEAFYKYLGMDTPPPEIRENQGEIELARQHKLPHLVDIKDIKGDLHIHSSYPIEPSHDMGAESMKEMLTYAKKLGYEYLGFSEHNPSQAKHTKQQIYDILKKRRESIEKLRDKIKGIHIINLMETDILPNGDRALDEKALEYLDATIVSVHSSFMMGEDAMTKRVLSGLSHPKAKILAHPTGRMLNSRSGYTLDWEKLFDYAKTHDKALEINAWPERLDLPDNLVKDAAARGVRFVIDTDAHDISHMDNMFYGVAVARRGWCEKKDILNTLDYHDFMRWLSS